MEVIYMTRAEVRGGAPRANASFRHVLVVREAGSGDVGAGVLHPAGVDGTPMDYAGKPAMRVLGQASCRQVLVG